MQNSPDHVILICATCKGTQSACDIDAALKNRLTDSFEIRTVDCMAGCDAPTTVAFQAKEKAQYLFGGIGTALEISALAEFAWQYYQSDDGWTNASERPRALFTKTLARLPRLVTEAPI
jgi:predicted metal-binding protein